LPEQFDFKKQSSVWQRLFYITANYRYKCFLNAAKPTAY